LVSLKINAIRYLHVMMIDAMTWCDWEWRPGWWCLIVDTSFHQKNSSSSHHRRREREKPDSKENPDVIQQRPHVQQTAGWLCKLMMVFGLTF